MGFLHNINNQFELRINVYGQLVDVSLGKLLYSCYSSITQEDNKLLRVFYELLKSVKINGETLNQILLQKIISVISRCTSVVFQNVLPNFTWRINDQSEPYMNVSGQRVVVSLGKLLQSCFTLIIGNGSNFTRFFYELLQSVTINEETLDQILLKKLLWLWRQIPSIPFGIRTVLRGIINNLQPEQVRNRRFDVQYYEIV